MILLPGCFCCKSCDSTVAFSRPLTLSMLLDVVQSGASPSSFGAFTGIKSVYVLDRYSQNSDVYHYNSAPGTSPDFSKLQMTAYVFGGPPGDETRKRTFLEILFPYNAWIQVNIECSSAILYAYGSVRTGTDGSPGNVSVTIQGVPFNPTYTLLSAASPVLPIRVVGNFARRETTSGPWVLIPVDFTITSWLPFEQMT